MNTNMNGNGATPGLTPKRMEKIKKGVIFSAMALICAGCIYWIFAPSSGDKTQNEQGFMADIPMPKEERIIDDKRDAWEQEQIRQRQSERMRTLQDFSTLLGNHSQEPEDNEIRIPDEPSVTLQTGESSGSRSQSSIQSSATAYRDFNRTLGSFYENPREDPEKEQLKQELEELKERMNETQTSGNAMENHLEMMEKSFQMAAKYIPEMTGTMGTNTPTAVLPDETALTDHKVTGNNAVVPVDRVRDRTVSALLPEMSDAEFIEAFSRPRNTGFMTPSSETVGAVKNTITACIHTDQTVMDGQNVRIRLLESMQAGNVVIPVHTVLTGTVRIQGERLAIVIKSLEYGGMIMPLELRAYDIDGQEGVFIPGMQELNAAKEIVANMGTAAGTSINLSNDAGQQFIADMGRNVIQGVTQFTARKLREVKVHLKAGYLLYLINE